MRNAFHRAGRAWRNPIAQTAMPAKACASAAAPRTRICGNATHAIMATEAIAPTAKNRRPHSNHRSLTQNAAADMEVS